MTILNVRKWRFAAVAMLMLCSIEHHIQAQTLTWKTSWLGNSSAYYHHNIQHDIEALYVSSNGTCFVDGIGNEGAMDCGIYKSGTFVNFVSNIGTNGGYAITANADNLFVATQIAPSATSGTNLYGNPFNPLTTGTSGIGDTWYGVKRCALSGSVPASDLGHNGYSQKADFLLVYTDTNSVAGLHAASIRGLAATASQLFVSDTAQNTLNVYTISATNSSTNGSLQYSVTLPRGGSLAYDSTRNLLWAISDSDGTNPANILCYDPATGTQQTAKSFTLPSVNNIPTALAMDNSGRLLITDNGQMQQNVLVYKNLDTTATPDTPIGVAEGILSGTGVNIGKTGNFRFNGPSGVGCDSSGNIYVACNGRPGLANGAYTGSTLESYSTLGTLNWKASALISYDMSVFDPATDGVDVYSGQEHFKLNLSSTIPGGEWSYNGYTLDPYTFDQDIRQHLAGTYLMQAQRVNNHLFHVQNLAGTDGIAIYRFDNANLGELAIPSVIIAGKHLGLENGTYPPMEPSTNVINNGGGNQKTLTSVQYIWTDSNGDGLMQGGTASYTAPAPDGTTYCSMGEYQLPGASFTIGYSERVQMTPTGDLWWSGSTFINHFVCGGLDTYGNPIYSWKRKKDVAPGQAYYERITIPQPFTEVHNLEYDPPTDVMFVSGLTTDYPQRLNGSLNVDGVGYIGRVIARYDHWTSYATGTNTTPVATWRNVDDGATDGSTGNNLPDVQSSGVHYKPIAMKVTGGYVFVQYQGLQPDTNSDNIRIYRKSDGVYVGKIYPDPSIVGDYTNIWVDLSEGMTAFARSTGEYLVLGEDDIFAKSFLYRWSAPPASPEGLVGTPATNTSIRLYWQEVPGETSYQVERSPSGAAGTFVQTGTCAANAAYFTDTGLSASTTYYYRVKASGTYGDSGYSNVESVTTLSTAVAQTITSRLLFTDFRDNSNPFTGPVNTGGTTTLVANAGTSSGEGVEFMETPQLSGSDTIFTCNLPANHPLVMRINQVLAGSQGASATFTYSYKVQRLVSSNGPASTNGRAGIETISFDGNPPAGGQGRDRFWTGLPSFGSTAGSPLALTSAYLAGNLITVDQASYPEGFDGTNNWRGYKFKVTSDGTGKAITGLNLTFESRTTSATSTPEAYMVGDLTVDEVAP
ncbi:MAG: hypothetical protein WCD79_01900 [Chthoniobacteraceae bacterium]